MAVRLPPPPPRRCPPSRPAPPCHGPLGLAPPLVSALSKTHLPPAGRSSSPPPPPPPPPRGPRASGPPPPPPPPPPSSPSPGTAPSVGLAGWPPRAARSPPPRKPPSRPSGPGMMPGISTYFLAPSRAPGHRSVWSGLPVTPPARVQIDFLPQCFSQFSRAHEKQRRETPRALNNECSPKAVDCTKEFANLRRIGDGGKMDVSCWRQGASKVRDRITRHSARRYAISKYLAAILLRLVRRIQRTATLDASKHFQHRRSCDLSNRIAADPRKNVRLQASNDLFGVRGSPLRRVLCKPFPGN